MSVPLDALGQVDFAPHIDSAFRLRLATGEELELRLVEVAANPHLPPAPERRHGFSVIFRSALPGHVPQGIYHLEHERMGSLELFLVPIGPRGGTGMCYEAVFN
jgi:Domain of unknown function (DUF6916)